MEKIVIVGCGGHARSVTDSILSIGEYEIVGFTDREPFSYRGLKVLGDDEILPDLFKSGIHYAFIGIGFMGGIDKRYAIYEKLKKNGFIVPAIIDPTAIVADDAVIGEGTWIGKRAVVNANATVGKMCIINTGAIVDHDCRISDSVHISVGSVVCGGCCIASNSLLGANAAVKQMVKIGEETIIGMGSCIIHDVPDEKTVYGVY